MSAEASARGGSDSGSQLCATRAFTGAQKRSTCAANLLETRSIAPAAAAAASVHHGPPAAAAPAAIMSSEYSSSPNGLGVIS
jgi:hypothetical protein